VQDGEFGLGGNLRDQLLTALESRWNADDPGATTLEPTTDSPPSADTAATPAPAPQPSTDAGPPQDQSGEDGAGGGRAAEDDGQGAAASPPPPDASSAPAPSDTPPAPPAADDAFDLGSYFNDYFGTPLNREQAQHLAGMISGLQNLTPDQRAELDRVLAQGRLGQYPATMGVPAQPSMHPQQQMPDQQQMQQQQGVDPAVAILGPRPDDEYLAQQWDITARATRAQHEQMTALQADIARTTEMEMQRQQAQVAERTTRAQQAWRESHPILSDAEFDALTDSAVRSGTFPALVNKHHGDIDAATAALYDQHFWADPALREKAIANLASGRQAGNGQPDPNSLVAQQQAQTDAGRQALASSVAGGGGSVTPQSTSVPSDPDKRKAAMTAEIAAQHDFT
jgi:hypothetical protein